MSLLRVLVLICLYMFGQCIHGQVFDPTEYGAKGDGITDDTAAVRATLAAVAANNGGEVLFNKGFSFLTGCFNVTSNVILNVKGRILASQNSDDYVLVEPLPWFGGGQDAQMSGKLEWQSVIRSFYASNITITGGGLIDGQGAPWWACWLHHPQGVLPPCSGVSRPQLLMLVHTTDVKIYDITFKDSPSWNLHLANCTNVHIYDTTILAPPATPNTDGIDIDCSVNVLVENVFYTGNDDAIAVKSGMDYNGRTYGRPTENVMVRNMTIDLLNHTNGGGLSIGSEMSAGVRNVTFVNCTVRNSHDGVYIKSQRGRGGIVEDITYKDIRLLNLRQCVYLTMNYHPNIPPTNATATPQFRNIVIDNIYCNTAKQGYTLDGLPELYIHDVSLSNIHIMNASKLFDKCDYIYGSCSNLTVTPSCPPCLQ